MAAARTWAWVLAIALAAGAGTVGSLALRHGLDARETGALEAALAATPAEARFDRAALTGLPDPARRYLAGALAPGTPLARSVRLTMEGRFRLGGEWVPFTATERLASGGFVWDATLDRDGTAIRAWDSLGPEGGATRVWMLGLVPLVRAEGPDVTRSAAGRLAAELFWLPAALLPAPAGAVNAWEAVDADTARYRLTRDDRDLAVSLRLDAEGRPQAVWLERWGDPDGDGAFDPVPFGGEVGAVDTFDGVTIPTRVVAGWGFGTDAWAPFFEVAVTSADFSGGPPEAP